MQDMTFALAFFFAGCFAMACVWVSTVLAKEVREQPLADHRADDYDDREHA
jgi:hypothetical protein